MDLFELLFFKDVQINSLKFKIMIEIKVYVLLLIIFGSLLLGVVIALFVVTTLKNKKTKLHSVIPAYEKTISKSFFETNYWEFKKIFDNLPEMLPVPENPVEKVNNRTMTEKEMTEGHTFFSKEEAFGFASKMVQDKKEGLVWFEDEIGDLCMVIVWLDCDGWNVGVVKFDPSYVWRAGNRSFFRN